MIRRLLFSLACCLCACSLSAGDASIPPPSEAVGFTVFADFSVVDSLWTDALQVRLGLGADLGRQVSVEIPVSCVYDKGPGGEFLLDLALMLNYHPWGDGPFIGVSLAGLTVFLGDSTPDERVHCINHVAFGYTWRPFEGMYLRPQLLVRDPSSAFTDSLSYISSIIPSYGRYRICLEAGWVFAGI